MDNYLYDVARRLIAFDTVSSKSNRPAIDYLAGELEPLGFHVAIQTAELLGVPQANLIAWIGPEQRTGLIISGHVDTVPFEGQPGWTCDPLKLTVQDDRLYGRGTSDMKGFIAQCLAAARGLNTATLKRPLVFLFTASEEVGCLGAARAATELSQTLGETPMPHLAWIGEPTSYAICHAHKSIVSFEIIVRGIGGHSGAPARGVNAIAVMARAIEAVGQLQEERRSAAHPEFSAIFPDAPTDVLNFGTINGGLAANIIAEECRLRISYRSMPDADPMALY
ncbi:MAG TPA: M20/M25/M40 family metallo-hydrolase, partial [Candidatus Binataceae bacterium]|nr:M20/M25/M40 family metallo-hydrolase [Candidatus Binataceae bacterium]